MSDDRTVKAIITGASAGAVKAFQETALAADSTAATVGDKFEAAGGRVGGVFSKLGNTASSMGLPFAAALGGIGDKFSDVEGKGKSFGSVVSELGKVSLLAGAAGFAAVAGESIHLATAFQSTVTSIASNAGIPLKAAQAIGNAFLNTAGQSIFSGQEIGTAYAAVAGQLGATEGHALSAAQALSVMKASSDLAEASGTSLGTATSSLSNIMQAFQIPTTGASKASDILYNSSRLTGQGIDSLTATFDRVHSKLGDLSPSLSTMSGLLVDMTEHGITGRAAVTALSTAFTGMAAPTAAVAKAQQALGVSFINAKTGALDPMNQIIGELGPKIDAMGNAQATATLKAIGFGTGSAALVNIIRAGPSAFAAATDAVNKSGAAQAAAQLKSGTLHDQIEILKATVEDLGTKFGNYLIPKLEDVGKALSDVIGWFEKNKTAAEIVGALIGGALVAAMGYFIVTSAVATISAMSFWTAVSLGLVVIIPAVIAAVTLLATHWDEVMGDLKTWSEDAINFVISRFNDLISAFDSVVGKIPFFGNSLKIPLIPLINITNAANDATASIGRLHDALGSSNVVNGISSPAAIAAAGGGSGTSSSTSASDAANSAAAKAASKQLQDAANQVTKGGNALSSAGNTVASTTQAASTKLTTGELAIQTAGTAALNTMVTAAHRSSLAQLNVSLNATHTAATARLVTALNATHNAHLKTLATQLLNAQVAEEAKRTKILTTDAAAGTAALNTQLGLTTSTSLTALNTGLNATHNAALAKVESTLSSIHTSKMTSMVDQLVTVHKQAMANWIAQSSAAAAAANLSNAQSAAQLATDQQNVANDSAALSGLSSDALAVAQAQLAVDQQKFSDDQQSATLQAAVNSATTATAQANATAALDNFNAQAAINEANLNAALSAASARQSLVNNGQLPALAAGGIVSSPTLALIGESGPEAVIPLTGGTALNPAAILPLASGAGGTGRGGGDIYDFSGMTVVANDPQTLVNQLRTYIQRNGSLAAAGVK